MTRPSLYRVAPCTCYIIGINLAIWLLGSVLLLAGRDNPFTDYGVFIISGLQEGRYWELFSNAWVHDYRFFPHVILNMLTLWFAGRVVEYKLKAKKFILLYILGGVASTLYFCADLYLRSGYLGVPINQNTMLLGASGAICAVFAVYAYFLPGAKKVLLTFVAISFLCMLLGWIPATHRSSHFDWLFLIAHSAHLGGVLFGWAFMLAYKGSWKFTN